MKQSIYLHSEIVDILKCYGTLEDVVNRILEEAAKGYFDVMDKPACPSREGAGRYDINIVEPNYLELLSVYSPFSPKISVRRLIYWFVENEIYADLGWEPTNEFENRHAKLLNKKLANALNELEHAKTHATNSIKSNIEAICNDIIKLQEYLKQ